MYTNNINNVKLENVDLENATDVKIQWLITKSEGAENYAMRRFVLGKNGYIPVHQHPWEHEIYILKGKGLVGADNEIKELKEGDVAYIPPDIPHWYKTSGEGDWIFLCIIPYKK